MIKSSEDVERPPVSGDEMMGGGRKEMSALGEALYTVPRSVAGLDSLTSHTDTL